VTLSTAGRRFIAELRRGGKKLEREMLKTLSDTERSTLHTILLKLYVGIEDDG
jgi:DNA-binding MarR family transcriptional regulator